MANPHPTGFQTDNSETTVQDRGLFGFGNKGHEGDVHVPAVEAQQKPSITEKKGLTEKIKEKLPGGHKDERVGTHVASGDYMHKTAGVHHEEKKGLTEKIKETLPGGHKDERVGTHVGTGDYMHKTAGAHPEEKKGIIGHVQEKLPGNASTAPPHVGSAYQETPEKKGVLGKIKEMLPGGHKDGVGAHKGH